MISLNKALLNPYFWGGTFGGGRLTSHETSDVLLGRPIFKGELLVLGSESDYLRSLLVQDGFFVDGKNCRLPSSVKHSNIMRI